MTENRHFRRKLARESCRASTAVRSSASHVFSVLLAVIALAIQILVVQPHIHASRMLVRAQSIGLAGTEMSNSKTIMTADQAPSAPRDNYPINEDPANCPICQVITLASHYIAAAVILIITPTEDGVAFAVEVASPVFYHTHSHSWRGRAPPSI
jgi:hypothetical protein